MYYPFQSFHDIGIRAQILEPDTLSLSTAGKYESLTYHVTKSPLLVLGLGLQSSGPGIGNAALVLSTSRQVWGLGFSHTPGSSQVSYKVLEKLWRQQDSMGICHAGRLERGTS